MIQAVKETIRCSMCGCIALADATKCPKCGTSYRGNKVEKIIDAINYVSNPTVENEDIKMIRAYYQFTCPRHGEVYVESTVVGRTIKCPFCL